VLKEVAEPPALPSPLARGARSVGTTALLLGLWATLGAPLGHAASIVVVSRADDQALDRWPLETAARLYGLALRHVSPDKAAGVRDALRQEDTVGAVISADGLTSLDPDQLLVWLRRGRDTPAPLLIAGVGPTTDSRVLRKWSGGALTGCQGPIQPHPAATYLVAEADGITRELGGQTLPFLGRHLCRMIPGGSHAARPLLSVRNDGEGVGGELLPLLVRTERAGAQIFLLARQDPPAPAAVRTTLPSTAFSAIAPAALFVRHAAGESGWQAPGHYANLTIDDPWLTEPYGHLSYRGLLEQMEAHDFHTTIAFVPWNYDRNDPATVALIRERPRRFSIAIHGNNHDRVEFPAYDKRPLDVQLANVRQAVARMEQFRRLTGLPYDRVMIFPHRIAPAATLAGLKRYNYAATFNSSNVPIDVPRPGDPLFPMRAVSTLFEGFASVRRHSVEAPLPEREIAVDAFLGNPLLFYGHHVFFARGISAFNDVANRVRRIQPDVLWCSLGCVAKHLYLQRRLAPTRFEVLAFSPVLTVENPTAREATFLVRRGETGAVPVQSVTMDGRALPYRLIGQELTIELVLPARVSREIRIEYESGTQVESADITRSSWRVTWLRHLSDVRDLLLSRSAVGLRVMKMYDGARGQTVTRE
jgi:hypothetical protein